jgi:hypothetical protein
LYITVQGPIVLKPKNRKHIDYCDGYYTLIKTEKKQKGRIKRPNGKFVHIEHLKKAKIENNLQP